MTTTPIAADFAAIAARLKEIEAERAPQAYAQTDWEEDLQLLAAVAPGHYRDAQGNVYPILATP